MPLKKGEGSIGAHRICHHPRNVNCDDVRSKNLIVNTPTLQMWLGHRDIKSTMVYLKGVQSKDAPAKVNAGSLATYMIQGNAGRLTHRASQGA